MSNKDTADALASIADALHKLGIADAHTPMGALEAHGIVIRESAEQIANSLHDVADAIRDTATGG